MKKCIALCFIVVTVLFNFYNTADAWEDVCELAAAMEENGVRVTIKNYKGRSIDGKGLLKDVGNIELNPCTYYIQVSCDLEEIANIMVYVDADYNRMRKVGSQVSFEGRLYGSAGWKEFVGSREPYIQIGLGNGRVSWAD